MAEKITLRSLAAEAGVAPATVMRALNGHPNVSPALRERLVALAEKHGYRQCGERRMIGIIVNGFCFFGYLEMMLFRLCYELEGRGFQVEIFNRDHIDGLGDRLFAGVVSMEFYSDLERIWGKTRALPMVCLNATGQQLDGIYSVSSDDRQGIELALDKLHAANHRRIALLTCGEETRTNFSRSNRVEAFEIGTTRRNIHTGCTVVNGMPWDVAPLVDQALTHGATAIIAASELLGHQINFLLSRRGIRVPQDISVLGFEYDRVSECSIPPLSTVGQDFPRLAAEIAEILERLIAGDSRVGNRLIDYRWYERESIAPAPAAE